jgi:hypothetical protein
LHHRQPTRDVGLIDPRNRCLRNVAVSEDAALIVFQTCTAYYQCLLDFVVKDDRWSQRLNLRLREHVELLEQEA